MRIAGKLIQSGERKLLPVFCAGLVAGILIMNIGKSILLSDTGLFDEYTLYHMKYMTVDGNALFCYVFRKRMLTLLAMAIMATTYLGFAVCVGMTVWYGMSAGVFLASLMLRYGIKGLFLAMAAVFPQMLLYVPAVLLMLGWCENLYRTIYTKGGAVGERKFLPAKLGMLAVIAGLTLIGCVLEGYVNPGLLIGYLKVF